MRDRSVLGFNPSRRKNLTWGGLNQNLFSVAGEGGRDDVRVSTFQYFIFYNFTPKWGFGTAPIILYDWDADRSKDALDIPLGAGLTYTFRAGKTPSRLLFEYQKYVVDRETYGPDWNFRVAWALFLPKAGGK